jgi:TetR/AcrR family transcriptional regulator, tetracycline repressor protein
VQDGRLSPESIVAEAIRLLNEEGMDGVSLRKLAARLGISAPSLYWHFADKGALMAAIVETVFDGGLKTVPAHKDWKTWMQAFGMALWKTHRETRDFARLVATTNINADQMHRAFARIRESLAHIDLEEGEAMRIQSCVQAQVLGWATFASSPYAGKLAEALDFEKLLAEGLELLLAGEALKLAKGGSAT